MTQKTGRPRQGRPATDNLPTSITGLNPAGYPLPPMKCIICYQPERPDGTIVHRPTCADYVRPVRAGGGGPGGRGGLPGAGGPVDVLTRHAGIVARLREGRRGRFACPSCGAPGDGHGVRVDVDGDRVLIWCFSCGNVPEIMAALHLDWEWLTGKRAA